MFFQRPLVCNKLTAASFLLLLQRCTVLSQETKLNIETEGTEYLSHSLLTKMLFPFSHNLVINITKIILHFFISDILAPQFYFFYFLSHQMCFQMRCHLFLTMSVRLHKQATI